MSQNPTHSSSPNQWEQHDDWKSNRSWNSWRSSSWTEQWRFLSSEMLSFCFAWQSTECVDKHTCRTPHFHMYSHTTDHTAQMTCVHRLKGPEGSRRVVRRKASLHPRVMVRPLLHVTLSTSSPFVVFFSEPRPVVQDPRQALLRNTPPPQLHYCC